MYKAFSELDYMAMWNGRPHSTNPLEKIEVDLAFLRRKEPADPELENAINSFRASNEEAVSWNRSLSHEDYKQLDYQHPAVMRWTAAHRKPYTRHVTIDLEKDPNPVFPS